MLKLKIILIFIFILFIVDGCHTHLHFSPEFNPKMEVNKNAKDTASKKDTAIIMQKQKKKNK